MRSISPRKLWLPAAAVAFVLVLALLGSRASIRYDSPLRACVFDSGTGGGLGLVLWARQLGIPARGLEDPLWEAVERAEFRQGNCFLTAGDGSFSPWGDELTGEEWDPIKRWIARGNALVIMTTNPSALPKSVIQDVLGPTPDVALGATNRFEKQAARSGRFVLSKHGSRESSCFDGGPHGEPVADGSRRRSAVVQKAGGG